MKMVIKKFSPPLHHLLPHRLKYRCKLWRLIIIIFVVVVVTAIVAAAAVAALIIIVTFVYSW